MFPVYVDLHWDFSTLTHTCQHLKSQGRMINFGWGPLTPVWGHRECFGCAWWLVWSCLLRLTLNGFVGRPPLQGAARGSEVLTSPWLSTDGDNDFHFDPIEWETGSTGRQTPSSKQVKNKPLSHTNTWRSYVGHYRNSCWFRWPSPAQPNHPFIKKELPAFTQ